MSRWRRWASLWAVLLGAAVLLPGASTASAHTGFDSSSPAQDEVVAEPVSSVVVVFTGDTEPVEDLLVARDATGELRTPAEVTTDDQRSFVATFEPPLAGGEIGIRWTVLGADGHPLEGSFSFTVTAPLPTTVPPTTIAPTTVPAATVPAVTTAQGDTAPGDTVAAASPAVTTDGQVDEADPAAADSTVESDAGTPSLDEFLAVEAEVPGGGRRLAGRLLSIPAVAAAIGAIAFLAGALRGPRREIIGVVTSVRVVGVVIAVGALIEYLGSIAATDESFATGWADAPSRSMTLRLAGAILIVGGLRAATRARTNSLSAAVIDTSAPREHADATRVGRGDRARWDPSSSKIALTGIALLVASFWFDGHTVTKGWRPLHAVVNSVHVLAGSVWFGGVITLAALAWMRHRRGDDTRIGDLVVRFSSIATVALIAVAAAGLVLAVLVLDGFGELTGTEWGNTLLLKTSAVALAATLGAYNHFRLRPALVASPDDAATRATLRSVLTAEAILLSFVVVVTAWLVAAAT